MPEITPQKAGGANICAFLDMIAHSELGHALLDSSDNGYNVIVGSTASHPILFDDYNDHPNRLIGPPIIPVASTAAGRYQLLHRYFEAYKVQLNLPDFGPLSQDVIAIQQIKERHAIDLINNGHIAQAIYACSNIWASLPGNNYGQHQNQAAALISAYQAAGGKLAAA
ncbi:glycoside hydrolase family protein [Tolumonas lignilytica]|uniref:glycoside hydrolase family 24 protein n=1 Tax=Tolumonas lignilytica TaxID=1283284 RepID=UPI0004677986|nr:glycoside hydrolase family 104 protein [Tolumonas lignilytica]